MSFEKSKCSFIKKTKLKDEQVSLDSIVSGASNSDIEKVLWINAEPQVDSIEPLTKEVTISGKASIELVCLDKENKLQTIETNVPFLTKFINDVISPTSKIKIIAEVADTQFSSDSAKVNVVLNFTIEATNFVEMELLNGGDDNICIKEEEITSQRLIKDDCMSFNEEVKVNIAENFEKILSICSAVFVKDVESGNNFFTVQGDIQTKIYYCTDGAVPKINCFSSVEPFKREIEAGGVGEQCIIDIEACVKKDGITYEREDTEEGLSGKATINIPINICFLVVDEIKIPCAVDIFALKNNLEIVTNSFEKTIMVTPINFESKVEGSVSLSEDEPRIDKICGVSMGNLHTTNQYIKDGEVFIEGIIAAEIVYLNDDLQSINTVKKEIPFVISEKANSAIDEKFCIFAKLKLYELDAVARRGREIFIDAKIKACIKLFKLETGAVITDAIMGEPLMPKEEAIEIYFGKKGDDLWQIAKELRTQLDIILTQNPEITNPLDEDKNIVIYHQKTPLGTSVLAKKDYDF